MTCDHNILQLLHEDLNAHVPESVLPKSRFKRAFTYMLIVLRSSGFHLVLLYRLSHMASSRFGYVGRIWAGLNFWFSRHWFGCSVAATARIEGGVILPHPQGIVIGGEVVIGPRAWIFQNVTIGGAPGKLGQPQIGADARIYAGAVITGPVTLGNNVIVGANAVVSQNVTDRMIVRSAAVQCVALPVCFQTGHD